MEFAAKRFTKLYIGPQLPNADPPPGADDGGCTGQSFTTSGHHDTFAYMVGKSPAMKVKSVAVVSENFGAAIFIAPAAKPVLKLIGRYGDLGGWPRTDAGRGDYYGVLSPMGVGILSRPTKVIDDGSGFAEPYVVLLPAAAALWLEAMRRRDAWLYALDGGFVNGKHRILLVEDLASKAVVETMFVDPDTGAARLGGAASWRPFGSDVMSQAEIEYYARKAR